MRLEDGTGLKVVEALREARPDARIVMLTGYGNIATAVAAVKAGAVDYLSKPADADDVAKALLAAGAALAGAAGQPDERRPGALGAHPARLRALRPQRLGDRAAPQHAPPHPAAHPGEARRLSPHPHRRVRGRGTAGGGGGGKPSLGDRGLAGSVGGRGAGRPSVTLRAQRPRRLRDG